MALHHSAQAMLQMLSRAPVMPIILIHDADTAVGVARALVEGGVTVFEVLLRTPAALQAVESMRRHVPEATVGAGTLMCAADVQRALDAGAQFGVTPGLVPDLAQAAVRLQLPLLPGVWTASEVMQAMAWGFEALKLFPANGLDGVAQIEHLQGVFPRARFCPTGGIKPEHITRYLALRSCPTVGGSWVTPQPLVAARDYAGITALARQAAGFAGTRPA
ncbi:MAG: bifunctional 4-hydroxy-2-oxoglutarate aldolase/2-dehydro-3-deoxy-phosphogluconate aldolase [Betaproteobacteria bacterium]